MVVAFLPSPRSSGSQGRALCRVVDALSTLACSMLHSEDRRCIPIPGPEGPSNTTGPPSKEEQR